MKSQVAAEPAYRVTPLEAHATLHELCPSAQIFPGPPSFHFGTWPAELAKHYYGRARLPAAGVFTGHDIEVGAGLLLRTQGAMIEAPALNWQLAHIEQAVGKHGLPHPDTTPRAIEGQCALILTPGYPIFGHWLAEILPRLGLLDAAGHDLDSLTYIVPDDTPDFGLELLRLVGIGPDRLVRLDASGPVRPAELLMPTFPHNGRQFVALMAHAAELLRGRVEARFGALDTGGTPPALLVSRHGWGARKMANRAEFEAMATRHGFQTTAPETLPMLDQLRLFAGARRIIGEYGSALHGSLFSAPGTVVCALRGTQPHPAFIQSGIGDALGQPTGYVFGASSDDPAQRGFSVALDDVEACLDAVFGGDGARPRATPMLGAPATPTDRPARPVPAPAVLAATSDHRFDPAGLLVEIGEAMAAGAFDVAQRLGERMWTLSPRTPGLAEILSSLHTALGRPADAIRFAIAAIDHDPSCQDARARLSALLPAGPARAGDTGTTEPVDLDFTGTGNARAHLLAGWSQQEPRHTWMVTTASHLALPALAPIADWLGLLDASPMEPSARLGILYDGHELARLQIARPGRIGFRIPREVVAAGGPGMLTFEHPDCISPRELGRNRDPRRLAFATRSLVLTPDPARG